LKVSLYFTKKINRVHKIDEFGKIFIKRKSVFRQIILAANLSYNLRIKLLQ